MQAVNTAIREMNMPIGRILLALEPPADIGVAVLSVETSGTAVKIGGALKNGRTLRPVTKGRFKSLVDVHGFDKRKIKKCVTTIATAFLANYALGKSPAHPAKKVVNFSPQCFIAGKNRAQIRDHGYPAVVRKTWGGIAGKRHVPVKMPPGACAPGGTMKTRQNQHGNAAWAPL